MKNNKIGNNKRKNNRNRNKKEKTFNISRYIIKLILKILLIIAVMYFMFVHTNYLVENIDEEKIYSAIDKTDINLAKYKEIDLDELNSKNSVVQKRGYNYTSKNITVYNVTENEITSIKKQESQLRKENCVPASITKLFTIKYVLDNFKLEERIRVGEEQSLLGIYDTRAGIIDGQQYSVSELIKCALLPSGGDAIYTLSKAIVNKSEKRNLSQEVDTKVLVSKSSKILNEYFKNIGFNNTNITDPTGIREDTTIGIMDVLKVSEELAKSEYITNITNKEKIFLSQLNGKKMLLNTNKFIDSSSIFYDKNVIGLKTGTLDDWYNICVLLKYNNKKYIIVQTGAKTDLNRYNDVHSAMRLIYNNKI